MLTSTTPFLARRSPLEVGSEVEPALNLPPEIQTRTGTRSLTDVAGVHTFRYRQSSLVLELAFPIPCMHAGANFAASFTPFHLAAGWGARHRKTPTAGAAHRLP